MCISIIIIIIMRITIHIISSMIIIIIINAETPGALGRAPTRAGNLRAP